MLFGPALSAGWPVSVQKVSLFGSPPSAGTMYTSRFPSYSPVNAIHVPSGE